MKFEHPTLAQIPGLRALWKEAFGDSDEFLDLFFENAFSPQRCLCAADGEMMAAAYWFSCGKYAYIYAVATAKAHRGKGLCHELMAQIHRLLASQGYAGAIVVPGEESLRQFYAGMGYENFGGIREFACDAGPVPAVLTPLETAEFARLRRQYLPAGSVAQEGENLEFLRQFARFYAGPDFLVTVGPQSVAELLGNTEAAPGILAALGRKSGNFRTPGATPFAMYKPLGQENPPTYFGFAFD